MTPDAVHHPLRRTTRLESLDVPREALNVHLWIVAGVPADIIHQLAALVETDVGVICKLTGISRSTVTVSIHRNSIDTGKMRRSSLDPTFLLA